MIVNEFITENRLNLRRYSHTAEDQDVYIVDGYACHFNRANLNGEIVDENSFQNFFEILERRKIMPYMDYDHSGKVIGAWESIEADENGLKVRGHIYKNIGFVRNELVPLIENGDLSYLSTMGFASEISEIDGNTYKVGNFELLAISLVNIPADMEAFVNITANGVALKRNEYKGKKIITNKYLYL